MKASDFSFLSNSEMLQSLLEKTVLGVPLEEKIQTKFGIVYRDVTTISPVGKNMWHKFKYTWLNIF
jgi:hypothetical protein